MSDALQCVLASILPESLLVGISMGSLPSAAPTCERPDTGVLLSRRSQPLIPSLKTVTVCHWPRTTLLSLRIWAAPVPQLNLQEDQETHFWSNIATLHCWRNSDSKWILHKTNPKLLPLNSFKSSVNMNAFFKLRFRLWGLKPRTFLLLLYDFNSYYIWFYLDVFFI